MGIMDRDYMYEDYETKIKSRNERLAKQARQDEIFKILQKPKLTWFDKRRLNRLMEKNKKA